MEVAGRGYPAGSRAARGAEHNAFFGAIFRLLKTPDHFTKTGSGQTLETWRGKGVRFVLLHIQGFTGRCLIRRSIGSRRCGRRGLCGWSCHRPTTRTASSWQTRPIIAWCADLSLFLTFVQSLSWQTISINSYSVPLLW